MADAGLFIGSGAPVRGREAKGLEVFNEALAYYGRLEQEGVIEGFETVILGRTAATFKDSFWFAGARRNSLRCGWTMSSCVCRRAQA